MAQQKQMKLGFIMQGPGKTSTDWRHPDAVPGAMLDLQFFLNQAKLAERGKLHFLFYADGVHYAPTIRPDMINRFEPFTILSAMAVVTSRIGLAGTLSTTYTEPYNAARLIMSLDHISGGRAGWNVVTSTFLESGKNFSMERLPEHDERYRMADEHIQIVQGLWDSWDDDSLVYDKQKGIFFDPAKVHELNFKGEFYQVRGPLNMSRGPQGQPVIFQAGASNVGKDFAAKWTDGIFVGADSMEEGQVFFRDVKRRRAALGRDPDKLLIFPGVAPYIGSTQAEAEAKYEERVALIPIEDCLRSLSRHFGYHDLSQYKLEAPFPDIFDKASLDGMQASVLKMIATIKEERLTLRQAAWRFTVPKGLFIGPPEKIADLLQDWIEGEACDGFMIGELLPHQFEMFVDEVVPILQKRGVYHQDYEGTTLRQNLGLERPAGRFSGTAVREAAE